MEVTVETPLIEDPKTGDTKSSPKDESCYQHILDSPWKWICCTFRIRLVGIILLLLLQIPLLGYYYSSSNSFTLRYTNSYQKVFFEGIFGRKPRNDNMSVISNSIAGNVTLSTVITIKLKIENSVTILTTAIPQTTRSLVENLQTTASSSIEATGNTSILFTSKAATEKPVEATSLLTTTGLATTSNQTVSTTAATTTTIVTTQATQADGSILPKCPPEPPNLQGRLSISFDKPPMSFEDIQMDNPLVKKGGHASPPLCVARHKVAIIIPYRDRVQHLQYFVQYMHPILQRQQIDYQIFIINQIGSGKFNRAKLMNIGFLEASKLYPFECYSFHDVDLVLEDDRSLYWCSNQPRHMSAGVDKFNYVLPYSSIFGGVTMISKEQMEKINGFSNDFWGWGGEDDDVFNRLKLQGYKVIRYPMNIARYKMIRHEREKGNEANPKRFQMIGKTKENYLKNGLNSIEYKVLSIDFQSTYTNITVDVNGPP